MRNAPPHPLLALLRTLSPAEKLALQRLTGIRLNYLYQLATGKRPNISAGHALKIEDGTRALQAETGRTAIVTVRDMVDA